MTFFLFSKVFLAAVGFIGLLVYANERVNCESGFCKLPYWVAAIIWLLFVMSIK